MAVKIRLMRVGKKKQPTYRVVVADGRSPRDGRFIEILGQYAPREDPSRVNIDADQALAWLRKGAQPTEQVQKLLTATGVWAQYEAERTKPAVTKLSRRGYVTGKVAPSVKKTKDAPAPAEPAAPPAAPSAAEAAAEAPAAEAPVEEAVEQGAVEETPTEAVGEEAPGEEAPGEEAATDE